MTQPATLPALQTGAEFPLTATQEAYLIGRGSQMAFGQVGCHGYWEWRRPDGAADVGLLEQAWNQLVRRHDSLRTVIVDGAAQRVLHDPPDWSLTVNDWTDLDPSEVEERTRALRESLSHRVFDPERYPLWDLAATRLPDGDLLIHFSLDLLIADAWSYYQVLVPELAALLQGEPLPPDPSSTFHDWVLDQEHERCHGEGWARAEKYWADRLESLPSAPTIPSRNAPGTRFTRLEGDLDPARWRALQGHAAQHRVSPTGLMTAILGDVLQRWGAGERFVVTIPTFSSVRADEAFAGVVGDFTSTILLEVDGSAATFTERAVTLQRQLWKDLPHSAYSGIHVARALARRTGSTDVAYPIVVTSLLGQPPRHFHTAIGEATYTSTQTPQVSLDVQLSEVAGKLCWSWDYRESAFPDTLIPAMFEAFCGAVDALTHDAALWDAGGLVAHIPVAQATRRDAINDTAGPLPADPAPTSFLQRATQEPDRPAIIDAGGASQSYGEVSDMALRVSGAIAAASSAPGPVPILLEKGPSQIIAAQGASHAGRMFVPLDVDQPADRLGRALSTADPSVVITSRTLEPRIRALTSAPVLIYEDALAHAPLTSRCGSNPDCYSVFTSGSTGEPKGVVVPHAGVANAFAHMNEIAGVGPDDVGFAVSPFHFDLAMYETIGIFMAGGSVVVPSTGIVPRQWVDQMARHNVTVWNSTPALLGLLLEAAQSVGVTLQALRAVIIAGDRIPPALPNDLHRLAPNARFIASGGPAETCVWSIVNLLPRPFEPQDDLVPYGTPMRNQRYRILDAKNRDVPDLVTGEMVVESEVGLARGYLNSPEETNAKFGDVPGTTRRFYRTGDLGRWNSHGQIEIHGRTDFQVKVNGVRIELGEVVSALKSFPGIDDAVVVQAKEVAGGPLVGFVIATDADLNPARARAHVESRVQRPAVPARIVPVPQFPLSVNGKVDLLDLTRQATTLLRSGAPAPADADLSPVEAVLLACWRSVIDRAIGAEENFFNAGATSLDVAKVTMKFGLVLDVDVDARLLFMHPTAASAGAAVAAVHGEEILRRCKIILNN